MRITFNSLELLIRLDFQFPNSFEMLVITGHQLEISHKRGCRDQNIEVANQLSLQSQLPTNPGGFPGHSRIDR